MSTVAGFIGAVGNTPLIRLHRLSEESGCEILGKAEFMNPGGSVKDRAAAAIIADAERRGQLKAGGIVVEGTAGNTGIGLAHVCNARGYRCIIVMPDNQSPEKYRLLEMLGAEVHKVPAVPYSNPNQYQKVAQRLAASLAGAIWSNQFDNTANRATHVATTGPEIWAQTGGRIDAFVAATKASMRPPVWSQISGPVVWRWISRLAVLSNWFDQMAPGSEAARRWATR